jgi:ABC-type Na+ transport system ATPase subunit NatA
LPAGTSPGRICGICSVSHSLAAIKAIEDAMETQVSEQTDRLRILALIGETIESHVLHIFMLHAPDFLGYQDAISMAKDPGDAVKRGLCGIPGRTPISPSIGIGEVDQHRIVSFNCLFDLPAGVRRQRAAALIERVGLKHAARRPLKEYSKGMVRRVGLATCLINDPELILLDEVAAGITEVEIPKVLETIRQIRDMGVTIVIIEHVIKVLVNVVDRIVVIDKGIKIAEGPPAVVMNDCKVMEAYFGA